MLFGCGSGSGATPATQAAEAGGKDTQAAAAGSKEAAAAGETVKLKYDLTYPWTIRGGRRRPSLRSVWRKSQADALW